MVDRLTTLYSRGALCYIAGSLFGPVPMVLVIVLEKDAFTKRCAAQALVAFGGLLASASIALAVVFGGLLAEFLAHGAASLDDSAAPPIVLGTSLAAGALVCGTYLAQFFASILIARRAARGEVVCFPLGGAAIDRAIARANRSGIATASPDLHR